MGAWVLDFGGLALVYGGIASLVLLALARLCGRFPGWHVLPFLFSTLTFVFLTQHPVPDPSAMLCPLDSARPQLVPLRFAGTIERLVQRGAGWQGWLKNGTLMSAMMNFLLCAVIGATLARHVVRLRVAALFGVLLTLTIELTQLTGAWGLWPCAWRQFDVDDLLMNALGVIAGFALVRALRRRRQAQKRA